jgi:uncharacterized membrane protein YiaA
MFWNYFIYVGIAVFVVGAIVSSVYAHKMEHILQDEGVEISALSHYVFPRFLHEYRSFLQTLTDQEKRERYSRVCRQACLWRNIARIAFATMIVVTFVSMIR